MSGTLASSALFCEAEHFPSPEQIRKFADRLKQDECFQEDQLAEAYYDWERDGALLYEGDRDEVFEAAWLEQGYDSVKDAHLTDEEQGWRMWTRFTVAEQALLLLVHDRVSEWIKQATGAFPMPAREEPTVTEAPESSES